MKEACDEYESIRVRELEQKVRELEAKVASQEQDLGEYHQTLTRLSDLLTRTANALKGPPPELTSWDWSDLPEVAQKTVEGMRSIKSGLLEVSRMLEGK